MTEKTQALYAGGAVGALIVGAFVAKLVLLPADHAGSRPAMHAVAALGAPDAFGSGSGLTTTVTPPSSPILAAMPETAPMAAREAGSRGPAARPSANPNEAAQAEAPEARDTAAVDEPAAPAAQPGRPDSEWGRAYAAPPARNGYFAGRRPGPPPRATPEPPPRYASYGAAPEAARPWDVGPPPGPGDDGPE